MTRPTRLMTIALACAAACSTLLGPARLASSVYADNAAPAAAPASAPAAASAAPAAAPAAPMTPATPAAPAAPDATAAPVPPAAAPDQTPAAAPGLPTDSPVLQAADDFWHYARIARYDQAVASANKLIASGASDADILQALDTAAKSRQEDVYDRMLQWQQTDALKDVATQLLTKMGNGVKERVKDPAYIRKQIERLSSTQRGYVLGVAELRRSGELAVPFMIEYLRDPAERQYHAKIRQALIDLGRQALNPLCAATEMQDPESKITIINVLASIGYEAATPYIVRIANDKGEPPSVRDAATRALVRMGAGEAKNLDAGKLFYDLAEKFYYNNANIAVDRRNATAYVWTWDEATRRLKAVEVPPSIFNDVMSMRSSEYALKLDTGMADAVSLWLAADFKREADLPEGQKDPSRPENTPTAHYYAVASGTQYLEKVVARSLRDRNSAVSLRSIKSLADIAGQSNLFSEEHQPIIDALTYPDRLVRFEAALALANALPQKSFNGQENVVPILADALSQNGKPSALVVAASQDQLNQLMESLKGAGYNVQGGTTPDSAIAMLGMLPAVDAVVISERLPDPMMNRLLSVLAQNIRTERVPRVFVVASSLSPWATTAVDDPLVNIARAGDASALPAAIQAARQRSGSLPLDEKLATEYALRSADMLGKLAISRGQVFDLTVAQQALLAALSDPRADVAKAAAKVLGLQNSKEAQQQLFNSAGDDKTPDDVKAAFYRAGAVSAKFYGNMLEQNQIDALQKVVESAANPDVRAAAAEARGALNLPVDEAQKMIVNQSEIPSISGPTTNPSDSGTGAGVTPH